MGMKEENMIVQLKFRIVVNVYVCSGCLHNLSGINERDRKIEEDFLRITENKRGIKDC